MPKHHDDHADLEVRFRPEDNRAVIEGKTKISFEALVKLILQRKVFTLFKKWGNEPIVVGSELLTSLASAPQDSQENKYNLILTSIAFGVIAGIFGFAVVEVVLHLAGYILGLREYLMLLVAMFAVLAIALILVKMQRVKRTDGFVETMESLSAAIGRK